MGQPCRCGGSGVGSSLIRQLLTGKRLPRQPAEGELSSFAEDIWRAEHAADSCQLPMF